MFRLRISCIWILSIFALTSKATDGLRAVKQHYILSLTASSPEMKSYLQLLQNVPREKEVSDQNVVELQQQYEVTKQEAWLMVETLREDGSWPDLDYADTKRSGWEPKQHAERILRLTKFYYNHPGQWLANAIHSAMAYWFRTKPICRNWWYNQIGVPRTLGQAFLLFESEMSEYEKVQAIEVMKQSRISMTGQNRVWLAGNVLMRALLQKDTLLLREARNAICSEIVLGKAEGIKEDWSFHQHGPQQQFGNYGLSFLCNMSFYAGLFAGTPYAFEQKQVDILVSFLLKGYQWVVWRGRMDVNALNRQLFRNADVHKALNVLSASLSLMRSVDGQQAIAIKRFVEENFFNPPSAVSFVGTKHFYTSDLTIHRTPQWMASLRMASERVIGTELVNEDNLKGYYMADGALYIYARGDEYHNIFPFWNWRRIPGITTYDTNDPVPAVSGASARNKSRLVGGCTDGATGLAAMELNRDGLHALKAWFFQPGYVLCLGTDIRSERPAALVTSVDQRFLHGEIWQEGRRYYHDGTGYVVLDGDSCIVESGEHKGQWSDFMGMYKPQMLEADMFSLAIKHESDQRATYQYVVLPASTRQQVCDFNPTFEFAVARNDSAVQAVLAGGKWYIAAYKAVTYRTDTGLVLHLSKPGTYIFDAKGLLLASRRF